MNDAITDSSGAALVIMAAGAGSRFGGPKQMTPIGPHGEWLLEFAIFDARRAGFSRVVLIVREEFEAEFRARLGRLETAIEIAIVHQRLDDVPVRFRALERTKPWGTGQAVLAARHEIRTPFAIVNADDFYGRSAYVAAAHAARRAREDGVATVVGMRLTNTLSPHGPVKRAWCHADGGRVTWIEEVMGIERRDGALRGTGSRGDVPFDGSELVSMNFWVFPPAVFGLLAGEFERFLDRHGADDRSEFLLPDGIGSLIADGRLTLEIVETPGPWFGLTYREDFDAVAVGLRHLTERGDYPSSLWSDHVI